MKKSTFVVLFLMASFLNAQKVIKKSITATNILYFHIDLTHCYQLLIETSKTNEMEVEAISNGEYRKNLLLNVLEEGSNVWIRTDFQPDFKNPNDKLSAHKVISIALKIKLPEYKNVVIVGDNCNTTILGDYKNLEVTLLEGKCTLKNVSERISVTTKSGDIKVYNNAATIEAKSKYGEVFKGNIPFGNTYYTLISATGNIYLKKTE